MCRRAKDGQDFGRQNIIGWRYQLAEEPVEVIQFTCLADEHEVNMNSLLNIAKCENGTGIKLSVL